jgi:hypothetical protein
VTTGDTTPTTSAATTAATTATTAAASTLPMSATLTWTQVQAQGPAPTGGLSNTSLFYDSNGKKLILFAGYNGPFEIWEYSLDNNTWTQLAPTGTAPSSARFNPIVVYVPESRSYQSQLILYGGRDDSSSAGGALKDTWIYDFATNAWSQVSTTGEGPACEDSCYVWDSDSQKLIAFGGRRMDLDSANTEDPWLETMLAETWAYEPSTSSWTNIAPASAAPAPRYRSGIGYDATNHKVVLCGGEGAGADTVSMSDDVPLLDTWTYDPAANVWAEVTVTGGSPALGYAGYLLAPIFLDPALAKMASPVEGGIYVYDLSGAWNLVPTSNPWTPERYGEAFAYDTDAHRLFLFGGTTFSDGTGLSDLWSCSLAQ